MYMYCFQLVELPLRSLLVQSNNTWPGKDLNTYGSKILPNLLELLIQDPRLTAEDQLNRILIHLVSLQALFISSSISYN
jgi:hypothetical protein